jgi:hypothetical protein
MFSLAGRLRPGKKAIACGERLSISEPIAVLGPTLKPDCPEGCGLFSALRLESHPSGGFPVCPIAVSRSGKKKTCSVPLW